MMWLMAFCGVVIVVSATPFRWRRGAAGKRRALEAYARRLNLPLDSHVNAPVMQRLIVRDRTVLIGGLLALVIAAPFVAIAIATAAVAIAGTMNRPADAARLARARASVITDYVLPCALWSLRGYIAVLALLVCLVLVGAPTMRPDPAGVVVTLALGSIALLATGSLIGGGDSTPPQLAPTSYNTLSFFVIFLVAVPGALLMASEKQFRRRWGESPVTGRAS